MVDAIGWKGAGAVAKAASVTTPTSVAVGSSTPAQEATPAVAVSTAATGLAKAMAAAPPVDTDRVAKIKAAIAAGKFPILPSTIADRLIALKLNWDPNAKA